MFPREFYLAPDTLLDAIPMIGVSKTTISRPAFPPHEHACMEFCVITGGEIEYFTEEDRYRLGPGSIQINQRRQRHGLPNNLLHPCKLYWIHVEPAGLNSPELSAQLARLPHHLKTGGLELIPHFEAILERCRNPSPHAGLEQQANLWMLLATVIKLATSQSESVMPPTLKRALTLIHEIEYGVMPISKLAQRLNTHRSNLHRVFTRHLGVAPQAYMNQQRLRRAAELLKNTSRPITEIAFQLDFNTTQHFATAFKARYGESPSAFRKRTFI